MSSFRKSCSVPKCICVLVCADCGTKHPVDVHDHSFTYRENDQHFQAMNCIDSFSLQVIFGPIVLPCGHTFSDHGGIRGHLRTKGDCPICRAKFTEKHLTSVPQMMINMMNSFKVVSRCDVFFFSCLVKLVNIVFSGGLPE